MGQRVGTAPRHQRQRLWIQIGRKYGTKGQSACGKVVGDVEAVEERDAGTVGDEALQDLNGIALDRRFQRDGKTRRRRR